MSEIKIIDVVTGAFGKRGNSAIISADAYINLRKLT